MIEISNVTKFYKQAVGLYRVDLRIMRGEVVGLIGDNGAGKTTLLKAVMGLTPVNSGTVTLDGKAVSPKDYEKLAFITEEGMSFPSLTVLEHGEFYRQMLPRFDEKRFSQLTGLFQLPEAKKARALSRGMLKKLELAVGLCRGADFVLMDEPLAGEDVFTRRDVMKLLIAGLTTEQCFVIATHQLEEMEPLLSRAVVLRQGRIVADTDMEHLREQGKTLVQLVAECYAYDEARVMNLVE